MKKHRRNLARVRRLGDTIFRTNELRLARREMRILRATVSLPSHGRWLEVDISLRTFPEWVSIRGDVYVAPPDKILGALKPRDLFPQVTG